MYLFMTELFSDGQFGAKFMIFCKNLTFYLVQVMNYYGLVELISFGCVVSMLLQYMKGNELCNISTLSMVLVALQFIYSHC